MYSLYVYYGRVGYVPAEWRWSCSSRSRSWITFLSSVPWKIVCEITSAEDFGEQKFPIFWKKKFSGGFGKKFADNCNIIYNDNTITAQIYIRLTISDENARAGSGWCVDCNCILYAVGHGATTDGRGTTIARHKRFPVAAGEATAVAVARRSGRSARGQRDGLSPPRGHVGVGTAGCSVRAGACERLL